MGHSLSGLNCRPSLKKYMNTGTITPIASDERKLLPELVPAAEVRTRVPLRTSVLPFL